MTRREISNVKTTEENFKIPIEELFPKFQNHIDEEDNNRILFSGKFGIGKTYFLKEFFKENEKQYEVFHLFPVDYQISSNEDIIDFLKYDILIELLKKNKDKDIFHENKVNAKVWIRLFRYFCKNNITLNKFLHSIISYGESTLELSIDPISVLLSKIGRPLNDLLVVNEKFQKFLKEYEEGEKGKIEELRKEIEEKRTSEIDYLSYLLSKKISEQKQNKKSVLILDDLERVDPEHIFRILNIFSAHYSREYDSQYEELSNKFGFDKVIIVADYANLKSIFHHKYGRQTDCSGYFNKFFSMEIFPFRNEEIINKFIDEIIRSFKIKDKNLKGALGKDGYITIILRDILLESLKLDGKEKLNLRQLLKGIKFTFSAFADGNFKKDSFSEKDQTMFQIINISIEALISVFDGFNADFVSVLKKIRENISQIDQENTRCFELYCYYLLQGISTFNDDGNENTITRKFDNYSIMIKKKEITGVYKDQKEVKADKIMPELFYELMIKYVSNKTYK